MGKAPSKQDVVKKYLNGDLDRFLKRVYRYNQFELIFSVTLKKYEKELPGITQQIKRKLQGEFPGTVASTINVHRVMCKYYGFVIDLEDVMLSYRIEYALFSEIQAYNSNRYRDRITSKKLLPKTHTKKEALKEFKARGFREINDFEEYDKNMAHIVSNANVKEKLYYPMNFTWDAKTREQNINKGNHWWKFHDIYLAFGNVGIQGYTRISTPGNR